MKGQSLIYILLGFTIFLSFRVCEASILRMIGPEDVNGAWAEIIRIFEKQHPGIKIDYISGPWSTDERENMYIRSFVSDDPIELVYMDVTWTAKFAEKGWLIPLEKWFSPAKLAEFFSSAIEAGYYKGHLWRIPVTVDVGILYYRKDLLPYPPRTWKDLEKICEKYSHPPELYCLVFQGMQYEGLMCNFLEYLWGAGGELENINSPQAIEALKFMKKLLEKGWAPKALLSFEEQHSLSFFSQGKALLMRNWPYAWSILNKDDSPLKGKIGIEALFHKEGHRSFGTLGGWGLGIAKGIKEPEKAFKFIEFVTSPKAQKILLLKRGELPARKSLFFDPQILKIYPHYPKLYKILLKAKPRPIHPEYPHLSDIVQKHVSAVLAGIETPEKAANLMASSIKSVIRKRKNWLKRLFIDVDLRRALKNTFVFTIFSVPIEFILGLLIALSLDMPLRGRSLIRLSVLIPWALPTAVMAMSWQWMFNDPFGVINDLLVKVGLLSRPFSWLSNPLGAMGAAIFADVWKTTPFVVIILFAGLKSIPQELKESMSIDGANAFKRFKNLTFPLLLPFIRVALIFRVIQAAGIFDLIWVLTKGGPADSTRTLAIYIYDLAFRYDDLGYALFLTFLFSLILIGISFLIVRLTTLGYERIK